MSAPAMAPLTTADVVDAARWLAAHVVHTPMLRSAGLDRIAGASLLLKAENLQLSGSYKVRGAMRAVSRVATGANPGRGVVAQSTGNHALAVALAAREYGIIATVVLPTDAPPMKIAMAQAYGARVILEGTTVAERTAVVDRLHERTGHAVIDAYDHPDVIAGQGSASLELLDDAEAAGTPLDALVVPVGGGGGIAGACLAAAGRDVAVYGVEPVGCDSLARSLAAGERVAVPPSDTLADGLRPSCVGVLPFRIARESVTAVLRVDDDAIAAALCAALFSAKILVEPSAAAALAGALQIAATGCHRNVGVLLTGGNVDPTLIGRLIASHGAATVSGEVQ